MDFTTIIAIAVGAGLIVFGIMTGGKIQDFFDLGSILITVGGTFAATAASFPLKLLLGIPKHFKVLLRKNKSDVHEYIDIIVEFAQEARRKGILALEDMAMAQDDQFLSSSIMLIVDAIEPEKAKQILENELDCLESRHEKVWKLYDKFASFAPGFGMIGTLIGLVNMLKNLDLEAEGAADALSQGMSTALITTFYGVILANLVFTPIANKLRSRHDEEMLTKEIVVQGVLAIQAGENPNHIKERLKGYIETSQRNKEAGSGDEDKKGKKEKKKKNDAA